MAEIGETDRTVYAFGGRHPILSCIGISAALPVLYFALSFPINGSVTGCWNPNGWSRCVSKYHNLEYQVYTLADRNDDDTFDVAEGADMCRRLGRTREWSKIQQCGIPSLEEMEGAIKSYQAELKK